MKPLFCPRCKKILTNNITDDRAFKTSFCCFDCLVNFEQKLRVNGEFKLYENFKMLSNELSMLKDDKQLLYEFELENENKDYEEIINSRGEIFRIYINLKNEKYKENLEEYKNFVENRILELEKELSDEKYKIIIKKIKEFTLENFKLLYNE